MEKGLIRAAGAIAAGIIDGIVQGIYHSNPAYYEGKFPYVGIMDGLGRADDLLILAGSGAVYAAGHFMKDEDIKAFGEGMLLYSGPMYIHELLCYWIPRALRPRSPAGLKKVSNGQFIAPQIRKPRFH
jgi:hypothetical protein